MVYCQDYYGLKTIVTKNIDGSDFVLYDFLPLIGLETYSNGMHYVDSSYYVNRKVASFGQKERKYYEIKLKKFGINNVIKRIVIGPKCRKDKKAMEQYLQEKGVNAEVIKSKIQIRD